MTKLNRKIPIPQDCAPIPNFEGLYVISPTGEVFNLKRKRRVITGFDTQGYVTVHLSKDGGKKRYLLHRIMMLTWKPVENSANLQVNHIDGQKWNYALSNLEWCTAQENMYHAWNVIEVHKNHTGQNSKQAVLTEIQVAEIRRIWNGGNGQSQTFIAKLYNVSTACINQVVHRKTWAHLY
jgi:hypothetical protein